MNTHAPRLMATLAVAFVALTSASHGQLPLANSEHAVLMERKLKSAQRVLAGVAREDFADVEKQAQVLRLLSQEAGWNVIQTPEYLRQSEDFRNTTGQLKQAAQEKNLDAVGLAFVKLSISCIDCHRHTKAELSRIGQRAPEFSPAVSLRR